jgi:hypothetical protein
MGTKVDRPSLGNNHDLCDHVLLLRVLFVLLMQRGEQVPLYVADHPELSIDEQDVVPRFG